MDVDPPFYQRETDSSNEDFSNGHLVPSQSPAYRFVQNRPGTLKAGFTQSSSADDYRSVIDDLTIENKRLREELKRYKQMGPDNLRREKLFEVKVHGLPSQKRRELEATLRDFTQSLDGSSIGTPKRSKKSFSKSKHVSSGVSKHPSSSSGSNTRPVDSAYASMSGPSSTGLSGTNKATSGSGDLRRSNQKIENYLRDIPEGLWPRANVLTEKDKKKLVVRRLEHLFTGQMVRHEEQTNRVMIPPISEDVEMTNADMADDKDGRCAARPLQQPNEPSREAQIRPHKSHTKDGHSRDEGSATNSRSREDLTESRDNGNGSGSGSGSGSGGHGGGSGNNNNNNNNTNNSSSPQDETESEQRPTRPRDLDPDRQQVPSENMEYIRHLGIRAPDSQTTFSARDVSPDADGWVYLNLLCSLAQLHILNVAPDFVRSAVSEKSTKFQLSPDGRKIRWRGGDEGTRFTSDGSGSASQRTQSSDDTDGSNPVEQPSKSAPAEKGDVSRAKTANFRPQAADSDPSQNFHYKPLFVHNNSSSSEEPQSIGDESGSSLGHPAESQAGGFSRWGQSGISNGPSQRKRRRDGAIIYYQGAPFCTDLSGDFGEVSPDTYGATTSSGDQGLTRESTSFSDRPLINRSASGSSLPFKPLSDGNLYYATTMNMDSTSDVPELTSGETDSEDSCEANFEWAEHHHPQRSHQVAFATSGLSGVYPDDHFLLVVSTRRPKDDMGADDITDGDDDEAHSRKRPKLRTRGTPDSLSNRLAGMTTNSPIPILSANFDMGKIEIEYLGIRHKKLNPVPLPPPSYYFPMADDSEDDDATTTSGLLSRRVTEAAYPDADELSGNDEEDEHSEGEGSYDASGSTSPEGAGRLPAVSRLGRPQDSTIRRLPMVSGSSAATAGGAVSDNSSLDEA